LAEFERAARRLAGTVVRTPLVPVHGAPGELLLKLETLQPVTNFKIRGIFNAVAALPEERRRQGLSTVSAGNTAQALAWAGRHFGVPARSLMPESAPETKIAAVRRYGGEPVLVPTDELFRFLRERGWEQEPYAFIHPWIDRDVMLGHGSMGLEIAADLPEVERVYVPVGGGGLMGGVGSALKAVRPGVKLIAVEPAGCPALHESLRQGHPARVECRTMCDGVAVPYITDEMFPLLSELVDETRLVTEDEVRATVRRLALEQRLIAEGSAALPVAAALRDEPGGPAVAILTGGSIDTGTLLSILG
jgi:threonine dehydratase